MIRRILDFVYILLFVWVCMIIGFWIIDSFIVPLELQGITNNVLSASLKVVISGGLVFVWLLIWREMIKRMFWRTLKAQ